MRNVNKHILIAEDDCKLLCSMRFALRCRGYHVTTVTNGLSALQKLLNEGREYDLLITDVKMPICDGIELLGKLNTYNIEIPVIAISAYDDRRTINRLTDNGCILFISKPFSSKELKKSIDTIFNNSSNNTFN